MPMPTCVPRKREGTAELCSALHLSILAWTCGFHQLPSWPL